jgi:hypothetical protein
VQDGGATNWGEQHWVSQRQTIHLFLWALAPPPS